MLFSQKHLAQVALSLFSAATVVQASVTPDLHRRATICNGFPELCNRSYGNVSFVGAHDSYAVGTDNLFANQDQNVTQQLNDGIRMLQVQAHNESNIIQLCHTSCSLFKGPSLEDYLTTVKTWLDGNPNEVLTILIVNIDNLPPSAYDTVFKAASVDTVSFSPESSPLTASAWPTLGSMIDSGKRLVTFLDNGADLTVVPYLIDEFTNIWETAFDVTDPAFDCNVNRTKGDTSTQMYLINHFLDKLIFGQPAPDIDNANITNAATGPGSLGAQVDTCVAVNTRPPNFMLVDFYEFGANGSVFQVAANINGVTYNPSTPIATPVSSSSSSSPTNSPSNGALTTMDFSSYSCYVALMGGIVYGFM